MDLQGKTAIVTGGAVRLGRALAIGLAEAGVDVCVHHAHSTAAARDTLTEITRRGVRGISVQADFTEPVAAARNVFERAIAEFGRVDLLINSAAIFEPGLLAETTEDQWDRHFAINLKAPFFLAQEFAAALPAESRGHIVNIADWRGLRPPPGHDAYTLTKSALVAMTRMLAVELGPRIQVNAIAPGLILPPPGEDESYLRRMAEAIPLRRPGSPADVVAAMLYLLRSDFVTGDVLSVTGGEG
ncbi:MAG: SDR family oxidoreductase [Planctomycetaceae bacterium]